MNIALLLVIIISKDFTIPKFYVIARLAGHKIQILGKHVLLALQEVGLFLEVGS